MGEFLKSAFAALPEAAHDNRALLAYTIASIAWVVVSLKVTRNKNLLKSIEKLPESQRLEALRMEMGATPVTRGVSPAQFLKARIHTYYFWAFITLCALVLLIFGIAVAGRQRVTPADIGNAFSQALKDEHKDAEAERINALADKISRLDLLQSPSYLTEQFGQPNHIEKTKHFQRFIWNQPLFWLIVEFSDQGSTDYVFTSKDNRLRPSVPWSDIRLGDVSFASTETSPIWANMSAKVFEFASAEGGNGSNAMRGHYGYVGYSGEGVDYVDLQTYPFNMTKVEEEVENRDKYNTGDETAKFEGAMKPNSFAYHWGPEEESRTCPAAGESHSGGSGDVTPSEEAEKCGWKSLWFVDYFDTFLGRD